MRKVLRARTARLYPVLFAASAALVLMWLVAATTAGTEPAQARSGAAQLSAALPPVARASGDGSTVTPSPTSCPGGYNYTYTVSSGTIVSGTNLVEGSQCGVCIVDVDLPFPFTFYGQTYTGTHLSTQGNMQFETEYLPNAGTNECPLPQPLLGHAILPHWSTWQSTGYQLACEQYIGSPCGIYTSTTGTAPNRIFNIQWRVQFMATSQHTANFEARLYESTNELEFRYGWVRGAGTYGAVGVQDGTDLFTQYSCHTSWGTGSPVVTWHPPSCWATPGPSHTPTPTPTLTRTPPLTPTPTCSPLDWGTVQSPNPGPDPTGLMGVAAVSSNNVWAVGSTGYAQSEQTLIQHWDGSGWNPVISPNPGTASSRLEAVDAVSANDIWAAGAYTDSLDMRARTLIVHWNGTQWSAVPSPNTAYPNWLASVEAISTNDVWAVGDAWTGSNYRTVTMHWDGSNWSILPSPNGPPSATSSNLMDVSATAPNDVWAVGYYQQVTTAHTLTLHWDGTQWSVIPSPDATPADNLLFSVKAFAANDAWAVGWAVGSGVMNAVALRWNGTIWTVVPDSHVGRDSWFFSVDGVSSQDLWAVGYWKPTFDSPRRALFRHWDGTQWHSAPAANQGPGDNRLNANAQVSGTDGWAVGSYEDGSTNLRTLTMRLSSQPCGTSTVVPTPTFTRTPAPTGSVPATSTRRPTETATATPTACPVQFMDVPEGHTFYPFVRCLACRGIVQGYADGTFRPNNLVTRGQVSKIVSLAAGFNEIVPPTQQSFEDVPYGSAFWEYVERISTRGIVVGYACGGAGEPCVPPENRPYFRPNAGATRGQLVKIVTESLGGIEPIPETQYTFADVIPGHTFWIYVESLLLFNPDAMSGYPCGTIPSEPCDAQNRPYFRPNNPLTRGQASKIVAGTFFPLCSTP